MENRESVYTQLARAINNFTEHKLNKVEFYNRCVRFIEIADENEKTDRLNIEKYWGEHKGEIVAANEVPYSNWKDGYDNVSE